MRRLARALGPVAAVVGLALVLLLAREAAGAGESGAVDDGDPSSSATEEELVADGQQLFLTACVTCHGVGGIGTDLGPPLVGVGEAAADFQLRTGRMPAAIPQGAGQPPVKDPAYTDEQIRALVAYVGSLGEGPPIPDVRPEAGDLAEGAELYLANCAACHNSAGIGGALSSGDYAPSLSTIEATQIGEAMRTGPGQMPRFSEAEISDEQLDSIVRYVLYLQQPADPGGFSLGGTGPTAEGFVAWTFGLGGAVVAGLFVTRETRRRRTHDDEEQATEATSSTEPEEARS